MLDRLARKMFLSRGDYKSTSSPRLIRVRGKTRTVVRSMPRDNACSSATVTSIARGS